MKRSVEKEQLDNLNLEGEPLVETLRGLAWINTWLGNSRSLSKIVIKFCTDFKTQHPIKIIDLGCGGGDLLIGIAKELKQQQIPFEMLGIDGNKASLTYAKSKTDGLSNIEFKAADILSESFSLEECDILISSHFIYHFTDAALVIFLKNNLSKVRIATLFDELTRNNLAYLLFKLFGRLMPINKATHQDGLLAIQRAFTKYELKRIVEQTGTKKFNLKSVPLFRQQLIIPNN